MRDPSWKDAVVKVLQESDEALHYTDIAEVIAAQQLRSLGATPANAVNVAITLSLNNDGDKSPFVRVERGVYWLRSKNHSPTPADKTNDKEIAKEAGLINAFGMYWAKKAILWKGKPQILGKQQQNSNQVDFCNQKGVYLLHDGRTVIYVGRTTDQPLGTRLQQHTVDRLSSRWDRFSWFGIYGVIESGELDQNPSQTFDISLLIATMEALLIEGLEPPQNRKKGDDFRAVEFLQVLDPELEKSQIISLMDELKKKL